MSTANVRIVTDSACDLPQSVVLELGITVVPLTIRINDVEYVDREQLSVDQFWTACAASPTPYVNRWTMLMRTTFSG